MRSVRKLAAGLLGASLCATGLSAEPDLEVERHYEALETQGALIRTDQDARLLTTGAPNDRTMAGYAESNIQIETEDDVERLSVAFGVTIESHRETSKKSGFFKVIRTKINVVGSAPLGDDKTKVGFFSGDSLVDGGRIKLSFTRLSNELGIGKGAAVYQRAAEEKCVRTSTANWLLTLPLDQRPAGAAAATNVLAKADETAAKIAIDINDASFDEMVESGQKGAPNDPLWAYLDYQCRIAAEGHRFGSAMELVEAYGGKGEDYMRTFIGPSTGLTFFGGDATLGQKSYQYLDRAAFKLADAKKTSWEVGLYAGRLNKDLTFSFRVRGVYGRGVTLPDEATVCHAVPGETEDHCATGPDGPPVMENTGLLSIETRHLLPIGPSTRIALAPQVAYRFGDKEFGAELPIYLAPDENGKLNGGIKLGYTTKNDDFSVGLFVGVPFSIFYQ